MKNYKEIAKRLLGNSEARVLTAEDRRQLKNHLVDIRAKKFLRYPFDLDPTQDMVFRLPMNVLAARALVRMGAQPEQTMPVAHLMLMGLADPGMQGMRHKEAIRSMVDQFALMPEDEVLEELELIRPPAGWQDMSPMSLAGSLLNRVEDLRDEILNG